MGIRIKWHNPNQDYDKIRIYRDTTRFDLATPPVPIAEVTSGEFYDDNTTERNGVYYYSIGVVKGDDEILSPIKVLADMPDTGPGPQKVLRGDYERGYFGELTPAEFITASELMAGLSLSDMNLVRDADTVIWHKFIHRGKILFMPSVAIAGSVSWKTLYEQGLVFGTDDYGPTEAQVGMIPTLQNRRVDIHDYTFKVRLLRGRSDESYDLITSAEELTSQHQDGELMALYLPLFRNETFAHFPLWSDYLYKDTIKSNSGADVSYVALQEHSGAHVNRFGSTSTVSGITSGNAKDYVHARQGWLPVLELEF